MQCPNITNKNIRNEFNSIIEAFGGRPMTMDEFKNKDIRNMRSGVDDSAMQLAYLVWDKTNGDGINAHPYYIESNEDEYDKIRNTVNSILKIEKSKGIVFNQEIRPKTDNEVDYQLKSVDILLSDRAKQVFDKGNKNNWSLDKILTELAIPKEQKQLLLDLGITDREQLISNIKPKDGVLEIFDSHPELANIGTQEQYSQYLDTIFPDSKMKDIVYHGTDAQFDRFDNSLSGRKTNRSKNSGAIFFSGHKGMAESYFASRYSFTSFLPTYFLSKNYAQNKLFLTKEEFDDIISKKDDRLIDIDYYSHYYSGRPLENMTYGEYIEKAKIVSEDSDLIDWFNYDRIEEYSNYERSPIDRYIEKEYGVLIRAVININSPKLINAEGKRLVSMNDDVLRRENNDSTIVTNTVDGLNDDIGFKDDVYVVFQSEQIHILGSKQDIEGFKEFVGKSKPIDLREQLALELASKYAYNVEVNTAKAKGILNYEDEDAYAAALGMNYNNLDDVEEAVYSDNEIPTQYYSSLTVPGGTNHTENEISTPLITPSIKGHARFATDKGIGWFRSDVRAIGQTQTLFVDNFVDEYGTRWENRSGVWYSIDEYGELKRDDLGTADMIDIHPEREKYQIYNNTGVPTKTRRILEIQSDFFQKIRNNFIVKGNNYTKSKDKDNNPTYFLNGKSITKSEHEKGWNEYLDTSENSEDAFLKLLLRNDNWATFFIKSIIQDSAKKGYEKVLFPKGETAAKIEGHQALADEINEINSDIEDLENNEVSEYTVGLATSYLVRGKNNKIVSDGGFIRREEAEKNRIDKINNLKSKKQELKSQGIEKLRPIEAFYEIKVGNILEKLFGKDNVKTITDEYGNQWREITIDLNRDLSTILFNQDIPSSNIKTYQDFLEEEMSRERKTLLNITNRLKIGKGNLVKESKMMSLRMRYNNFGKSGYGIYATNSKMTYNGMMYELEPRLKDSYVQRLHEIARKNYNDYIKSINIEKDGQRKIDFGELLQDFKENVLENSPRTHFKAYPDTEDGMVDKIYDSTRNGLKSPKKHVIRSLVKLSTRLSKRFNIKFEVLTELEAVENGYLKMSDINGKTIKRGAYDHASRTAFLIAENVTSATSVHEIFGHPFLFFIKGNKEYVQIYNDLAASLTKDDIAKVESRYSPEYESKLDDAILIRLNEYIDKEVDSSRIPLEIRRFFKLFTEFIKNALGIKSDIEEIRPTANIEQIAEWAIYGTGKIDLAYGSQTEEMQKNLKVLIDKFSTEHIVMDGDYPITYNMAVEFAFGEKLLIDTIAESGIFKKNALNKYVTASMSTVSSSSDKYEVYNAKGELILSASKIDDNEKTILYGIKGDIPTLACSIYKYMNRYGIENMYISPDKTISADMLASIYSLIPMNAVDIIDINGVETIRISTVLSEFTDGVAFMSSSRPTTEQLNSESVNKFLNTAINGLKSQLKTIERKGTSTLDDIDRVRRVIKYMENSESLTAAIKFIDHSISESAKVYRAVKRLESDVKDGKDISSTELNSIRSNFLTLFQMSMDSISSIEKSSNSIFDELSTENRNIVKNNINTAISKLKEIQISLDSLIKRQYAYKLADIGDSVGSTTIKDRLLSDIYSESSDISLLSTMLGGMSYSKIEQLRALHKTVIDIYANVNRTVEQDGVIEELYSAWNKVREKNPLMTFNEFMEKDSKGKYTGYIISDLRYGEFLRNKNDFDKKLMKKYGLKTEFEEPTTIDELKKFRLEKEAWLSENSERMFTKEYYELKKNLSPAVQDLLDETNSKIRLFVSNFIGEDGYLDTSKMTASDIEKYQHMKRQKAGLSSPVRADGTIKEEGTFDYDVYLELSEFNKAMAKGMKYSVKNEAFNEKYKHIKKTMSKEDADRWYWHNTKVVYPDNFYEMLDSLESIDQTDEYKKLYEIKKGLLKYYRNPDSMEINAYKISDDADLLDLIKRIDKRLDKIKIRPEKKSIGTKFSDFAEVVNSSQYNYMFELMSSKSPEEFNEWYSNNHYTNSFGSVVPYSFWTKLEPKDKSTIKREPNSIWSEFSKDSEFYNKNFDESKSENGLQPKRELYDNSKAFNDLMKDKSKAEFRDKLVDSYRKANKFYSYIKRPNNLRLAQVNGKFWNTVTHGKSGFMSGLLQALGDKFNYRSYDIGLGDYETRNLYNADGTPIQFVPTRYRTLLDNPNSISRDLLGSFAMYYREAMKFSELSRNIDDIEILLEGLKRTEVKSDTGEVIAAGQTNMYTKAKQFVNSYVYGDDNANRYEGKFDKLNIGRKIKNYYRRKSGKATLPIESGYNSISFAKPIKQLLSYIRKINLSFNPVTIFGNYAGAEQHLLIESIAGTFINSKDYGAASWEVAKRLPRIIMDLNGRSNNKIVSLMRFMDISRSNEKDMSNLHGWKTGRQINEHFWYGPYSATDFAVKSKLVVSMLMGVKLYDGEFLTKEQFITKHFPGNRSDAEIVWGSIKENLYGAFEIKDNLLQVKDKYKDLVTTDLLNGVSAITKNISSRLDGMLSDFDKTKIHTDVFGSALLMHRNWLLVAIQERFSPEIFSYEKQMVTRGQFRFSSQKSSFNILMQFMGAKMGKLFHGDLKGLLMKEKSLDKFSSSEMYNAKRMFLEMAFFLVLSSLSIILGISYENEDDEDEKNLKQWAYILTMRSTLEMGTITFPPSVFELYSWIGSPTAAESSLQQFKDLFDMFADGSFLQVVDQGRYEGKTKLERASIKLTAGYKNIYENFLHPDLKAKERFMKKTIGPTYDLLRRGVFGVKDNNHTLNVLDNTFNSNKKDIIPQPINDLNKPIRY